MICNTRPQVSGWKSMEDLLTQCPQKVSVLQRSTSNPQAPDTCSPPTHPGQHTSSASRVSCILTQEPQMWAYLKSSSHRAVWPGWSAPPTSAHVPLTKAWRCGPILMQSPEKGGPPTEAGGTLRVCSEPLQCISTHLSLHV